MFIEKCRLIDCNPTVAIADGKLTVSIDDSPELTMEVYSDARHVCVKVSSRTGEYEIYRTIETHDTIRREIESNMYDVVETELIYQSACANQTELTDFGVEV